MKRQNRASILESVIGAVAIGLTLVLSPLLRRRYNRWGATEDEVERHLPDDDRVPHPRLSYTRAITINAPYKEVWQWLVQIGQGRGGLYSYERLENLIGCHIRSVSEIIPAFQELRVDDNIRLGPKGYPLYKVIAIKPNHVLVLAGADPKTEQVPVLTDPMPTQYVSGTWVFVLEPHRGEQTRLIVRGKLDYNPSLANTLIWRVFTEPIGFVMERRMLLGIKQRAEARSGKFSIKRHATA